MSKLISILKLTRIEHSVMLIIAVLAAELIAGGLPSTVPLLLSIITAVFISMAAFAINDYFDVEVDRANKKSRPLVTGELSRGEALIVTAACILIGIAASIFINVYCLAIAIIFGILALLYSYKLKDIALIGNSYVALSMSIPFLFGNYVVSQTIGAAIITVFLIVFLSGLAREIDGTVRDYKGDLKRKATTLPSVIGMGASVCLALLLYVIAIALSIYLFLYVQPFMYNLVYLALIIVTDIMLLYSGVVFVLRLERLYGQVRDVSLAGMALALVCMLASSLVHIPLSL